MVRRDNNGAMSAQDPGTAPGSFPFPAAGAVTGVEPVPVTVIEPDSLAPVGRLKGWLEEVGARPRIVRLWRGESLPEIGGGALVVLGGIMSAHDEAEHPWIPQLRALLREAVDAGVPVLAVCLGAQIAAEALGGETSVPLAGAEENGVVGLLPEQAAWDDPVLGPALAVAGPAPVPVISSHDDGVARLPEGAVLLASSERCPVHTWRLGSLLAVQHHPEADPQRLGLWTAMGAARPLGLLTEGPDGVVVEWGSLPVEVREAAEAARASAEAVEPRTVAVGRALAAALVGAARAV